jgi:D-alanyl-D-alanine carboxypeptidase
VHRLVRSPFLLLLVSLGMAEGQPAPVRPPLPALPVDVPSIPASAADEEVSRALDGWLERLVQADAFSGVVLLERGGKTLLRKAYGKADLEWAVPNTEDTLFNIGSITKLFTKVAVAQLAAAGKVSVQDVVSKWLPQLDIPSAGAITIEMLLGMRSGLGDIFGPRFVATAPAALRELSDYVPLFAGQPLHFPPGTSRAYSNAGYLVLGLIVEKVSGMSYRDYLETHVFMPAGMHTTGFIATDDVAPHRATGYTREASSAAWRNSVLLQPLRGSSAGGAYATADDLARFAHALAASTLLSAKDTARMLGAPADVLRQDRPPFLGLGVAGGSPGWNSVLEVDARAAVTLLVLSNRDPPGAEQVALGIRKSLGLGGETK